MPAKNWHPWAFKKTRKDFCWEMSQQSGTSELLEQSEWKPISWHTRCGIKKNLQCFMYSVQLVFQKIHFWRIVQTFWAFETCGHTNKKTKKFKICSKKDDQKNLGSAVNFRPLLSALIFAKCCAAHALYKCASQTHMLSFVAHQHAPFW